MGDSGKQVGFGDVGCFRPGDMMKVWEYVFDFEAVGSPEAIFAWTLHQGMGAGL